MTPHFRCVARSEGVSPPLSQEVRGLGLRATLDRSIRTGMWGIDRSVDTLPMSCRPSRLILLTFAALAIFGAPAAKADSGGSPASGALIDLGSAHGCAVQADGAARCWGKGTSGRLGSGATTSLLATEGTTASAVLSAGGARAITSGDAHTCALTPAATVRCWGQGGSGQLGSGARDNRLDGVVTPAGGTDDPSAVPLGSAVSSVSAGGDFTCAVVEAGTVRCWGDGAFGALGSRGVDNRLDGLADGPSDDASAVPLGGPATAVSAGPQHACALMASGAVRCWGNGANGRLGTGATDDRLDGLPGPAGTDEASVVPLAAPATAITAGGAHTCALLSTAVVSCWGAGFHGQLGGGRNDDRLEGVASGTAPNLTDAATVVTLKSPEVAQKDFAKAPQLAVVAIAAGDAHTCAITVGGDVRCWGRGDLGQLGHSAIDARLDNNATQLTDAATRAAYGPLGLSGLGLGAPAVAITAAYDSTCAALSTGALRCWGSGLDGRLGSGRTDARLDGLVDPGSATDDASTVPIGRVPTRSLSSFRPPRRSPAPRRRRPPRLPAR